LSRKGVQNQAPRHQVENDKRSATSSQKGQPLTKIATGTDPQAAAGLPAEADQHHRALSTHHMCHELSAPGDRQEVGGESPLQSALEAQSDPRPTLPDHSPCQKHNQHSAAQNCGKPNKTVANDCPLAVDHASHKCIILQLRSIFWTQVGHLL